MYLSIFLNVFTKLKTENLFVLILLHIGGKVGWLRHKLICKTSSLNLWDSLSVLYCWTFNVSNTYHKSARKYQKWPNFPQMCLQILSKVPQDPSSVCSEIWSDFPLEKFATVDLKSSTTSVAKCHNYQLSSLQFATNWRTSLCICINTNLYLYLTICICIYVFVFMCVAKCHNYQSCSAQFATNWKTSLAHFNFRMVTQFLQNCAKHVVNVERIFQMQWIPNIYS